MQLPPKLQCKQVHLLWGIERLVIKSKTQKLFLQYVLLHVVKQSKYCKKIVWVVLGFFFYNMSLFFSKFNIQIKQAEPSFYSEGIWKTKLLLQNSDLTLLEKNKIRRPTETFQKYMWQQQDTYRQSLQEERWSPGEKKRPKTYKTPKSPSELIISCVPECVKQKAQQ